MFLLQTKWANLLMSEVRKRGRGEENLAPQPCGKHAASTRTPAHWARTVEASRHSAEKLCLAHIFISSKLTCRDVKVSMTAMHCPYLAALSAVRTTRLIITYYHDYFTFLLERACQEMSSAEGKALTWQQHTQVQTAQTRGKKREKHKQSITFIRYRESAFQ